MRLPKYQAKVEEIENQEEEIKFLEKEELALKWSLCQGHFEKEALNFDN